MKKKILLGILVLLLGSIVLGTRVISHTGRVSAVEFQLWPFTGSFDPSVYVFVVKQKGWMQGCEDGFPWGVFVSGFDSPETWNPMFFGPFCWR